VRSVRAAAWMARRCLDDGVFATDGCEAIVNHLLEGQPLLGGQALQQREHVGARWQPTQVEGTHAGEHGRRLLWVLGEHFEASHQ